MLNLGLERTMERNEKYDEKGLAKRCISCGVMSYKKCDECLKNIIYMLDAQIRSSMKDKRGK